MIFFVIVVTATILVITLALVTLSTRGRVYIKGVGFRKHDAVTLEYLANLYVDEKLIRAIYVLAPIYNLS